MTEALAIQSVEARHTSAAAIATGPIARIVGLDTIRFVCALLVALSHMRSGDLSAIPVVGNLATLLWANAFNGGAAVMAFFIISGFCIHFPQTRVDPPPLKLWTYYAQRLIRIGLPAFAIIVLYQLTRTPMEPPTFGVLWSVICEAVYYVLYPALLIAAKRVGWNAVLGGSIVFALTAAVALYLIYGFNGSANFHVFGLHTWMIGLPVWVAGCVLAERQARFQAPGVSRIWSIRLAIFVVSVVLVVVKFHVDSPLANCIVTFLPFSVAMYFWLGAEIAFWRERPPPRLLEWAGVWSYSLYLFHPIVARLATPDAKGVFLYLPILGLALIGSLAFYYVVERPSHRLARFIGARQRVVA